MGSLKMLGLMLWKAVIQKKRQPMVLFLEILWPILIFLVVTLVRQTSPPISQPTCHYSPRAMPNSGYRFLQTFVCGLDNACHVNEDSAEIHSDPRMAQFLKAVSPLYEDSKATYTMINDLPKTQEVFKGLSDLMDEPEVKELMETKYYVSSFFDDPGQVKDYFTSNDILSNVVVDAVMSSEVNITRMYELTNFVDFRGIVCNPEELGDILVFPSSVSIAEVSNALCALNDSLVPNIVKEVQNEISVANMIRMLSKIEKGIGDYDDAMMMEDVGDMIDMLMRTSTLKDVMVKIPEMKNATKWIAKVVTHISGNLDADLEGWEEILIEASPFIENQLKDFAWFESFKEFIGIAYNAYVWTQDGIHHLHELPLTLANMMNAETDNWIDYYYDESQEIVELLSRIELDPMMLSKHINAFITSNDTHKILCEDPGLRSLVKEMSAEDSQKFSEFQNKLCQININEVNNHFNGIFNFQQLMTKIDQVKNKELDKLLSSFNWTSVLERTENLIQSVTFLSEQLETFLINEEAIGGFQGAWQQIALTVQRMFDTSASLDMAYQLMPLTDTLDAMAKNDAHFQNQLNTFYHWAQMGVDAMKLLRNEYVYLPVKIMKLTTENEDFKRLYKELLSSDDVHIAFMSVFTDNDKMKLVMDNMNDIDTLACDDEWLKKLFTSNEKLLLSSEDAKELLCFDGIDTLVQDFSNVLDYKGLESEIEELTKYLDNTKMANATLLLNDITSFFTFKYPTVDMGSIAPELGINYWDAGYIDKLMRLLLIQQSYLYTVLDSIVVELGPHIEESDLWPMFAAPVFQWLNVNIETGVLEYNLIMDAIRKDSPVISLYNLVAKHGPTILSSLTQLMSDPTKLQTLTSNYEWTMTVCQPDCSDLYDLFGIPSNVPLNEIIQNGTETYNMLKSHYDHILTLITDFNSLLSPADSDFDWKDFGQKLSSGTQLLVLYQTSFTELDGLYSDIDTDAWNTAVSQMTSVFTNMYTNTASLNDMMTQMMSSLDSSMPGAEVKPSQFMKYYAYHANQLMKGTDQMLDMMKDMDMDEMIASSPMLSEMVNDTMDILPQVMDALTNAMLNPTKMVTMMMTTDLTSAKLCDDIKVTQMLDFPDQYSAAKFEEKWCNFNYNDVLKDIMQTNEEMAQTVESISTSTTSLMVFNIESMPVDYEMDVDEMMTMAQDMMSKLESMTTEDMMNMLPKETFDMKQMESKLNEIQKSFTTMNPDDITSIMSSMETMLPMMFDLSEFPELNALLNVTIDVFNNLNYSSLHDLKTVAEKYDKILPDLFRKYPDATEMIKEQMKYQYLSYSIMADLFKDCGTTGRIDLSVIFSDAMDEMIFTIGPDSLSLMSNDLIKMIMDQSGLFKYFDAPELEGNLCTNDDWYKKIFPTFMTALHARTAMKDALCNELGANKTWADFMIALLSDDMKAYLHEFETGSTPSLTSIVELSTKTMHLQEQCYSDVVVHYGTINEIYSHAKWSQLMLQFAGGVKTTFEGIDAKNFTATMEQFIYPMMAQSLSGLPAEVLNGLGGYVMTMVEMIKPWAGKDVDLQKMYEGSPESQKMLTNLKYFPVLYEAIVYTSLLNSQGLSTMFMLGVEGLCDGVTYKEILTVPSDKKADLDMAISDICKLNFTAIELENTEILDKYTQNIMSDYTATELVDSLKFLVHLLTLIPETKWVQDYKWFDNTNWMAFLQAANMTTTTATTEMAANLIQMTALIGDQSNAILQYIDAALNAVELLMDSDGFTAYPNLNRYFSLIAIQDEFIEVMLWTMLDQVKFQQLLEMMTVGECADLSTFQELVVVPEDVDVDLARIYDVMCKFDAVTLNEELGALSMQLFGPLLDSTSAKPVNTTQLIQRIMNVQNYFNTDPMHALTSMLNYNSSVWDGVIKRVVGRMAQIGENDAYDSLAAALDSLSWVVEGMEDYTQPWNSAFLIVAKKLELATNNPSFRLRDFFPSSPNMQKLMDFVENTPDVVTIMITSLQEQKLTPLLSYDVTTALMKLCHPLSDISEYIVIPNDSSIDIEALQQKFCSVNIEELAAEIMVEFHVNETKTGVSWRDVMDSYLIFREKYDEFQRSLPVLDISRQWTNTTAWISALSTFMTETDQPLDAVEEYTLMLSQLSALMGNETSMMMLEMLSAITDILKERMAAIPNGEITLDSLLGSTPALNDFLTQALELTPDLIETFLHATVKQPQSLNSFLMEILTQPDPLVYMCSKPADYYVELMNFPDTINFEAQLEWMCDIDNNILVSELMDLIGISEVQQRLERVSSGFNMTAFMMSYGKIMTDLNRVIANSSVNVNNFVNSEEIQAVLTRVLMSSNYEDLDSILDMYWSSMQSLFYIPTYGKIFENYHNAILAVMEYFNQFTAKIGNEDLSVGIEDLLASSDAYTQLLSMYAQSPDMVKLLTETKIRIEQIPQWFISGNVDLTSFMCDSDELEKFFIFPDEIDITPLLASFCELNLTAIVKDLENTIDYQDIITKIEQSMNKTMTIDDLRSIYKNFEQSLSIFTDQSYESFMTNFLNEVSSVSNLTWTQMNQLPDIMTYLESSGFATIDDEQIKAYGEILNQAMTVLPDGWWEGLSYSFIAQQMFYDVITGKITDLPQSDLTLADILPKTNNTLIFITKTFEVLPDMVEILMSSQIDLAKVAGLMNTTNALSGLCDEVIHLKSPSAETEEALRYICNSDFTAIVDEMKDDWNWPAIQTELQRIVDEDDYNFDWVDYLHSMIQYITVLQKFTYTLIDESPSFENFIMYDGNMTAWLERLNQAWQVPADESDDYVKMITAWLETQGQSNPESLEFFNEFMPYMNAVQLLARHLRERVEPLPFNMTISELLYDEPTLTQFLKEAFEATPSLLSVVLGLEINSERLTDVLMSSDITVQSIFCLDGIIEYPSEEVGDQVKDLICNMEEETLQQEVFNLINWEAIMAEFESIAEPTSIANFNWTAYVEDLAWIQNRITKQIMGPGSLTDFFEYRAGFDAWTMKIESALYGLVSDEDIFVMVENILKPLTESLPDTDEGLKQINNALAATAQTLNKYLNFVLQDTYISLETILLDSDDLKSVVDALHDIIGDSEVVHTLLQTNWPVEWITHLVGSVDGWNAFCAANYHSIVLPEGKEATLDGFKKSLCSVDIEALSAELQRHIDWKKMVEKYSNLVAIYTGHGINSTDTEPLFESVKALQLTITRMLNEDFSPSNNLASSLDVWKTAFENMFYANVSSVLNDMTRAMIASQLDAVDPTTALVMNTTFAWATSVMDAWTAGKVDVSQFEDLFVKMMAFVPSLNVSSVETLATPFFGSMALIPGLNTYICELTFWDSLVRKIGVDSSSVRDALCGEDQEDWYNNLVEQGLSDGEIKSLITTLGTWSNETFPSINTTLTVPQTTDFTSNMTSAFINLLLSINLTGQVDEVYVSTQVLVQDLTKLISRSLASSISQDEMFDEITILLSDLDDMTGSNILWKYAQSASMLIDYASQQIQNFNDGEASVLDIESLFPSDETLSDVTLELVTELSQALVGAKINITMASDMTVWKDIQTVLCDAKKFSALIIMDDKIAAKKIQEQLCAAAEDNSAAINNVISMLQTQAIIEQIISALESDTEPKDLWTKMPEKLTTFVNNVMQMLDTGVDFADLSVFNSWLNALSSSAMDSSAFSASAEAVCLTMIEASDPDDYFIGLMGRMQFYLEMAVNAMKSMPVIEEMICSMETSSLTDLYNMYMGSPVQEVVQQTEELLLGTDLSLDCANLISLSEKMTTLINGALVNMDEQLSRTASCIASTANKKLPALMEVDKMADSIEEVLDLLETVPSLGGMEEVTDALELIVKGMLTQQDIQITIDAIIKNSSSIADLFSSLRHATPEMLNAILKSSFSIDVIPLYNMTTAEIESIICNPNKLESLLTADPLFPVDWKDVSATLCSGSENATVKALMSSIDAGKALLSVVDAYASYSLDIDWFLKIIENFESIFDEIDTLQSMTQLLENLDLETLIEILPDIQQFLVDDGPSRLFDSLDATLESIQKSIDSDPTTDAIFDDIRTLTRGVRGLNVLKRYFPESVALKDMLEYPEEFKDFMETELDLSTDMTDALLNSSIAFVKVLNFTEDEVAKEICDAEKLGTLLTFNLTQSRLTLDSITRELCQIDKERAIEIGDYLIKEMSIGTLVKNLLAFSPDAILKKANITSEDLKTVASTFETLQTSLGDTFSSLPNLTSILDIESLMTPQSAQQRASVSLSSISNLICGRENAFEVEDSYGTVENLDNGRKKRSSGSGERRITTQDKRELAQFESEFCKEIYLDITDKRQGKVVWNYLKPLLRGKIPFAPDTPLTRAIMEEALSVVYSILDMQTLSEGLSDGIYDLAELAKTTAANAGSMKGDLSNGFVSSALNSLLGLDAESLLSDLESFDTINDEDADAISTFTKLISNITGCIEMDRLEGYATEEILEERARELSRENLLLSGVVFLLDDEETSKTGSSVGSNIPKHIKYKIRTDKENVPSTKRVNAPVWEPGPEDDLGNDLKYLRGFIELQEMIERAIIKLQTDGSVPLPNVEMKQIPYPCYERDVFGGMIGRYFVPIMMCLGWMVAVANAVRIRVYDHEHQIEETMKVMGLRSGINWLSWFISNFVTMLIMAGIIVLFLKLGQLFRFSDGLLLWLFLACFSLAVTMLCYLISVFFNRTTLASLTAIMIYLMSYLPYILVISMESALVFWHKALMSLSCTTALSIGTQIIANFEMQGVGVTWDTAPSGYYYAEKEFTFVWCCYMLLIDAAIYGIIGWYFNNLFPGKYGISQPWYFPLSPSYWGCVTKKPKNTSKYHFTNHGQGPKYDEEIAGKSSDPTSFSNFLKAPSAIRPGEADPEDLPVGISLNRLTKSYSKKRQPAVNDLSVNFYQEQITAVLGHNGAGKTSTINILTGVHEATSGSAYVNGKEIQAATAAVRRQLGFCPQFDALFDYLTVYEHLKFYADLKSSGSKKEKKQEIQDLLDIVGLRPSMHVKACQLSGGQKRRLSVALAFIGGSQTVILDEPTSGIDPAARRSIWNLIVKHRHGRTILLCTHHLDEADALGDRIIMMHRGKLVVAGSPLYLKTQFGSGYNLTIAKAMPPLPTNPEKRALMHSDLSMCTATSVLSFIQQVLPGSRLVEEIGSEITFVLPSHDGEKQKFKLLFEQLEANKDRLCISSYGVSDTSLEEIFLKLTWNADNKGDLDSNRIRRMDVNEALLLSDSASTTPDSSVPSTPSTSYSTDKIQKSSLPSSTAASQMDLLQPEAKLTGCSLKMRQFAGLICKRFNHNRRDYRSYLSQILLPCIFVALAMAFTLIKPQTDDLPPLRLSPSLMGAGGVDTFFRLYDDTNIERSFVDTLFRKPGLSTTCMEGVDESICTNATGRWKTDSIDSSQRHRYDNPDDCECTDSGQVCPLGAAGHPMPYWTTLQGVKVYNITSTQFSTGDYMLRTWSKFGLTRWHGGLEFERRPSATADDEDMVATVWYYNKGWHNMPSYLNALNNMLLRASLNASQEVNAQDYGITVINHPLSLTKQQLGRETFMQGIADTGIALCILCAFCFVPAGFAIYLINENTHKEKRLQFICGVGTLMYWGTAFLWDMMSFAFTVAIATAIAAIFQIPVYTANLNLAAFVVTLLLFGWAVIPMMYIMVRMFKESTTGYMVLFIVNLLLGIVTTALVFLLGLFNSSQDVTQAHDLLSKIFLIFPQFSLGECLVKMAENQLKADVYARFDIDEYKNPFSFDMLAWNYIAMAAIGAFFLLLNLFAEMRCCCSRSLRMSDDLEDEDVKNENARVQSGAADDDLLVIKSLSKVYRRGISKFAAVKGINVGVPRGQCFGLLGVNGAGKTTTFNMITGDTSPTTGKALFKGKLISQYHPEMDQNVGYCPQYEALDQLCTVTENLYLFCRLKGVPSGSMSLMCNNVMKRFGLEQYADQVVNKLSGGTKRKLSTAIALLGNPSLVLLDEPTTGMDPQTRRLVWNNILRVLRDDRSVILTSHSMSECDALCTRMAIMVNGKFKCIGTGQHLKSKYGTGYTLTIRMASQRDIKRVIHYVQTTFTGSRVKDQHLNQVTLETPSDSVKLSQIFGNLEQDRHKLGIRDYSVWQTTLDQIFVNFARAQTDGTISGDIEEDMVDHYDSKQEYSTDSLEQYPYKKKMADEPSLRGYPPSATAPYSVEPGQVEVSVTSSSSRPSTPPNVSIVSVHPPADEKHDDNVTIVAVM